MEKKADLEKVSAPVVKIEHQKAASDKPSVKQRMLRNYLTAKVSTENRSVTRNKSFHSNQSGVNRSMCNSVLKRESRITPTNASKPERAQPARPVSVQKKTLADLLISNEVRPAIESKGTSTTKHHA